MSTFIFFFIDFIFDIRLLHFLFHLPSPSSSNTNLKFSEVCTQFQIILNFFWIWFWFLVVFLNFFEFDFMTLLIFFSFHLQITLVYTIISLFLSLTWITNHTFNCLWIYRTYIILKTHIGRMTFQWMGLLSKGLKLLIGSKRRTKL